MRISVFKMKKIIAAVLCLILAFSLASCGKKQKIKVLILPHFEVDELSGDFPGEAQLYYEYYLADAKEYQLRDGRILYFNPENGVAMGITGSGKVNCAEILTSILTDERFNCSESYIFAPGCAGGAKGYSAIGDVCLAVAVCDNELGHTADIRELTVEENEQLWYHDSSYDDVSFKELNRELIEELFSLVKDIKLETTEISRSAMKQNFGNEEWANRDPKVILGVNISGDNYWKGEKNHQRAKEIVSFYFPGENYAMTEMEDIALADVAEMFGLLDRCIFLRVNVNPDVFMFDETPESQWGGEFNFNTSVNEENKETLDIFEPAMRNNFAVGSVIIDFLISDK